MKATIEVSSREEADNIRAGLSEPDVRAFVIVMGALMKLPSNRARARVFSFVEDHLSESEERKPAQQSTLL